jgi:hypothetical protein
VEAGSVSGTPAEFSGETITFKKFTTPPTNDKKAKLEEIPSVSLTAPSNPSTCKHKEPQALSTISPRKAEQE